MILLLLRALFLRRPIPATVLGVNDRSPASMRLDRPAAMAWMDLARPSRSLSAAAAATLASGARAELAA